MMYNLRTLSCIYLSHHRERCCTEYQRGCDAVVHLTAMRFQYDSIAQDVVLLYYSSSITISSPCYEIYMTADYNLFVYFFWCKLAPAAQIVPHWGFV